MKCPKQFQTENARLKELLAERDLDIMKGIAVKVVRAGAPFAGGLCDGQRPVAAAHLHTTRDVAAGARMPVHGRRRMRRCLARVAVRRRNIRVIHRRIAIFLAATAIR
jgi:hypothetical protein